MFLRSMKRSSSRSNDPASEIHDEEETDEDGDNWARNGPEEGKTSLRVGTEGFSSGGKDSDAKERRGKRGREHQSRAKDREKKISRN